MHSGRRYIGETLGTAGFEVHFVHSPTTEFGGSLHCLTASIHVGEVATQVLTEIDATNGSGPLELAGLPADLGNVRRQVSP